MIWGICATFIATLMPVIESREALINICKHMVGKGSTATTADYKDAADPPMKQVDVPVQHGDDTAHKGASQFHV